MDGTSGGSTPSRVTAADSAWGFLGGTNATVTFANSGAGTFNNLSVGEFGGSARVNVNSGGSLRVPSLTTTFAGGSATINISGGTLDIAGPANFNNNAAVNVTGSGVLRLEGNSTFSTGSTFNGSPTGGLDRANNNAIASLQFPAVAQASNYFNHFELHTQPNGHPIAPNAVNPNRYRPAHFDFHFYGVSEQQAYQIPFAPPPLPQVPADRLPAGYAQPGPSEPQMGRHSGPVSELTEPGPFSAVMIAGFTPAADQMHFLEPMVTRQVLLRQDDFTLPMPMPQTFDRDTRYPTTFQAVFQGDAHRFIFTNFIDTAASAPSADRVGPTADHTRVTRAWGLQPSNSLFDSAVRKDASADDVSTNDAGSVAELLSAFN